MQNGSNNPCKCKDCYSTDSEYVNQYVNQYSECWRSTTRCLNPHQSYTGKNDQDQTKITSEGSRHVTPFLFIFMFYGLIKGYFFGMKTSTEISIQKYQLRFEVLMAVTAWADDHTVFLRLKNLLVHFSPRAAILFSFSFVSEHTSSHPP